MVTTFSDRSGPRRRTAAEWHFQFTPHDVHDYYASAARARGRPVQAGRASSSSSHRTATLRAGPHVWRTFSHAGREDRDGRLACLPGAPIVVPEMDPPRRAPRCPALVAPPLYSASFIPQPACSTCRQRQVLHLHAVDRRGSRQELHGRTFGRADPRARAATSTRPAGRLGTAAFGPWTRGRVLAPPRVVVFGDDSGALSAASPAPVGCCGFQTQVWKSSPMTYAFDGRQHVAVASGPSVLAFWLGP